MKIITEGPEFTKHLNQVLSDNNISWESFEADRCGNLTVAGHKFHMRVGFYLKQPQQAILCQGQFVKFRPYNVDPMSNWSVKQLHHLNPQNAARLLYPWPHYYWHPNGYRHEKYELKQDTTILDAAAYVNKLGKKK